MIGFFPHFFCLLLDFSFIAFLSLLSSFDFFSLRLNPTLPHLISHNLFLLSIFLIILLHFNWHLWFIYHLISHNSISLFLHHILSLKLHLFLFFSHPSLHLFMHLFLFFSHPSLHVFMHLFLFFSHPLLSIILPLFIIFSHTLLSLIPMRSLHFASSYSFLDCTVFKLWEEMKREDVWVDRREYLALLSG